MSRVLMLAGGRQPDFTPVAPAICRQLLPVYEKIMIF